MNLFQQLPGWFQAAVLVVLLGFLLLALIAAAQRVMGAELHHFLDALKAEATDFRRRKKTIGAINWAGFITLLIFGVIVIVATGTQKLLGLMLVYLDKDRVDALVASSNYFALFFVAAGFLTVSIVCVLASERRGSGK